MPSMASSTELTAFAERRQRNQGPPRGVRERRVCPSGRRAYDAIKMACPFCGDSASAIVRTRGGVRDDKVGRRRECAHCGGRFPTAERVDEVLLIRELEERHGAGAVDAILAATPTPASTWENVERLLHKLWGQAKDKQYVKRDWTDFQQILAGLRSLS